MVSEYQNLIDSGALGYMQFPYTDRGITQYDIPVQTEYEHQTLSDFQRNKMLDDHIDYLMQNPVQQNYAKYQDWKDPGMDYGQRIWDPDAGEYRSNPQGRANIWRMHGDPNQDDTGWEYYVDDEGRTQGYEVDYGSGFNSDWDKLYGTERYVPASVPIPHHDRPAGYQDFQPNWSYINALENFKEYGGDIRMMNTADAYRDIDRLATDTEGNYIWDPEKGEYKINPESNVGGVDVGEELTGTGGFFSPGSGNITLNPANVVKKYPTAPMGPGSEWEFFGPDEVNVNTPYFDPLRIWNLGRILPHETGHFQEDVDEILGWDEPNPGAYLEGTLLGNYADFPRHPRMHMMDRSQWDWRSDKDKSLSKTQFANLQAAQKRGLEESLNRGYWHEEDFDRSIEGFGGSGRSRIDDRGRPMWQSNMPSPKPDKPTHHFNTGGLASLMI